MINKVKIVTDSTVDLSAEEADKYNINIVPLPILIDGREYLDRINITPSQFVEKLKRSNEMPKTSQPPIGKFIELYKKLVEDGSHIISIHMAGELSGTVRSAESAAKHVNPNITVIDSRYISRALGFQVLEAAKMAMQGKAVEEIVNRLKEIRRDTFLYVTVDTLDYLVKGGRIGRGKAIIGSLLHIKPIATLTEGQYTPVTKVRSNSQIVKFLTKQLIANTSGKEIVQVHIVHVDAFDLAAALRESILAVNDKLVIGIGETTPIISAHTGPGAIGFMYYVK